MSTAVVVAFGSGIVGIVWFALDSSRIPSTIWYWSGYSRAAWWTAALACLVALGLPALILAFVWRFGEARRALRAELEELVSGGRSSRGAHRGKTGSVA